MTRNIAVALPEDTHVQLTDASVVRVTVVNNSAKEPILLTGTTEPVAPVDLSTGLVLPPGSRLLDVAVADLYPGLPGVDCLWAYAHKPGASVFVSHADVLPPPDQQVVVTYVGLTWDAAPQTGTVSLVAAGAQPGDTVRWVLVPGHVGNPIRAQVLAGQGSDGASALAWGSGTWPAQINDTLTPGLIYGPYKLAVVVDDSDVASSDTINLHTTPRYAIWDAADADVTTGAISEITNGQPGVSYPSCVPRLGAPTISNGMIVTDGSEDLVIAEALGVEKAPAVTHVVPDAVAGDSGEGFTVTGLDRLPDGRFVCGNHGLGRMGTGETQNSGVVILSADLNTVLAEYRTASFDGLDGTGSVQGVAYDPSDGNIWLAALNDRVVLKFDPTDGSEVRRISTDYDPNGLAYDTIREELMVLGTDGDLRWYGSAGSITKTVTTSLTALMGSDMVTFVPYVGTQGTALITYGSSGTAGSMVALDVATGTLTPEMSVVGALAVEGVYFDVKEGKLYVASDEYFHNGAQGGNRIYEYGAMPWGSKSMAVFWDGYTGGHSGAEIIVGVGLSKTDARVPALSAIGLSGDTVRCFVGLRDNVTSFCDLDFDPTVDGKYWMACDLSTGEVIVRRDGVQVATGTLDVDLSARFFEPDAAMCVGGGLDENFEAVSRPASVSARKFGYAWDTSDVVRDEVETLLGVGAT